MKEKQPVMWADESSYLPSVSTGDSYPSTEFRSLLIRVVSFGTGEEEEMYSAKFS